MTHVLHPYATKNIFFYLLVIFMTNLIKLSNFELETKIRIIIKQLLEATSNKVSDFHSRLQGFDKHFITYHDRIIHLENNAQIANQRTKELSDRLVMLKEDTVKDVSDMKQAHTKMKYIVEDIKLQFQTMQSQNKTIKVTAERMLSENLKNRNKFGELSKNITDVRTQITQKIMKFVEDNIRINAEIRSLYNKIQNELFTTNLSIQRQKKVFEDCLDKFTQQEAINREQNRKFIEIEKQLKRKLEESSISGYMSTMRDNIERFLLEKDEQMAMKIVNGVTQHTQIKRINDQIAKLKQQIIQTDEDVERRERAIVQKMMEITRKHGDNIDKNITEANKEMQKMSKQFKQNNKKIDQLQLQAKLTKKDIDNKINLLKNDMDIKINQKGKQKEKDKEKRKNLVSEQILQKLQNEKNHKFIEMLNRIQTLEIRFQAKLKQLAVQVQQNQENMEAIKINNPHVGFNEEIKKQIANLYVRMEFIEKENKYLSGTLNDKIRQFTQQVQKTQNFSQNQVKSITDQAEKIEKSNGDFLKKAEQKIERLSFMLTKMRGDIIIKHEFSTKQIKQLIRKQAVQAEKTIGLLKIVPALSQSINLIMSLFYDHQYQINRVLHDNLPKSNPERFMTMSQGILYQYKQKRKGGTIYYRHREIKKIDILKATFISIIQIWESLLQHQFKEKLQFFPKGFYKSVVQKKLNIMKDNLSDRQVHFFETHKSISLNNTTDVFKQNQQTQKRTVDIQKSFYVRPKFATEKRIKDQFFIYESPTRKNSKNTIRVHRTDSYIK